MECPMATVPVEELVKRANEEVSTWSPQQALEEAGSGRALLVDVRDIRELDRDGRVEGAVHAPRGMLEFWFDPHCKYHREIFADPSRSYVLFCAMGWRSALAAKSLMDMGFENIAHIEGGFAALKSAGARITEPERPKQT
jgi:rhodanese-related sulfurtransferase